MVAECKSGKNIVPTQDKKYKKLKSSDVSKVVRTHDSNNLVHAVCYVILEANHSRLAKHTSLPFIIFGTNNMWGSGNFGHPDLNKQLQKNIPIQKNQAPRNYYSFSPCDNKPLLLSKICTGIISYAMQKGNMSRQQLDSPGIEKIILEITHSHHKVIDDHHREILTKKIKEIVDEAIAKYGLDPELTTNRLASSTRSKIERIFNRMAKDYQTQLKID